MLKRILNHQPFPGFPSNFSHFSVPGTQACSEKWLHHSIWFKPSFPPKTIAISWGIQGGAPVRER